MAFLDFFRKSPTAMSSDPAEIEGEGVESFSFPDISYNQLLDALNGSGDDGLSFIYKPRFYSRNSAICLVALKRCVDLLSSVTAMLMSNGHYIIYDRFGEELESPKAEALRYVLSHTLDGWEASSYGIKDAMADFLLDGNFLLWADKDGSGNVKRLLRLVPWSATTMNRTTDKFDYHAEVFQMRGYKGSYVTVPNTDVVHGRMTHLSRIHGSNGQRQMFARAPVVLMRPTLEAGLALDDYVRNFARKGHIQNISFNYKDSDLQPDQKKEISEYIRQQQKREMGFIINEDGSSTDITPKIDPNLANLRDWQVQDVARFYGVPGPLIAQNLTSWGQGIQELGRFFINYSVSLHVQDFCDAIAFRCLEPGARFELDFHKLLQADAKGIKDQVDAIRGDGQRPGIGTLAECRKKANLPKKWEGDLINQTPVGMDKSKEMNDLDKDEKDENENEENMATESDMAEVMEWARS